jgi:alkanesulfonate monooxygenase SsuD/methylene tetrahydromethanopterin reductase-like flavin-dependent oxidoreductase (luciferase family)
MHSGLALPNGGVCGDVRVLAELGCLAEVAGWDGVFVEDYIVHQSDGAIPTCDPWIALAAMAVGTQRIRLGTSVTPFPGADPGRWLVRLWPWISCPTGAFCWASAQEMQGRPASVE